MKDVIGILLLQIIFGSIMLGAISMGQAAERRCKPHPAPKLLNCRPYPEGGLDAQICEWPPSPPVNPWAPEPRRCEPL